VLTDRVVELRATASGTAVPLQEIIPDGQFGELYFQGG
jgi:hypothetical protein